MSDNYIYLKLKPFVAEFLRNKYGNPVKFDPKSVANDNINFVLQRRPPMYRREEPDHEGMTPFVIPYSKQKDPRVWNYVSESGKQLLVDYCESLFSVTLWKEVKDVATHADANLQRIAEAWCSRHGISIDYVATIRMRIYREKKKLLRRGIDLRKKKRASRKVK